MRITHSPKVGRFIKKLHSTEKKALDKAVLAISSNPKVGEAKKGDLAGVSTYKFKVKDAVWLLSYIQVSEDEIRILLIGPHENHYDKLKRTK